MMKPILCAGLALMLATTSAVAQELNATERSIQELRAKVEAADDAARQQRIKNLHARRVESFVRTKEAAEKGDPKAQTLIGKYYYAGYGIPQDYVKAVEWLRKAAEQGDLEAQSKIGSIYARGGGQDVPQDYAEAMRWFNKAAEQGDPNAQYILGLMLLSGQGVLQDYITAHMWLNIAAANGIEEAPGNRDKIAFMMAADAIVEAQRRARVCMASNYQDCD